MPLWRRGWAFGQFVHRAWQLTRRLPRPDLIHAVSTPPTVGELARWLARQWQVPWVFEVGDAWPEVPIGMGLVSAWGPGWLAHRFVRRIYREATHVLALSEGIAEQIRAQGVPHHKVSVSWNGTDTEVFRPANPADKDHTPGRCRVIYAGAFGRANALHTLLEAARHLPPEESWHFDLYGDGSERPALTEALATGHWPHVRWRGTLPKPELARVLPTYDVGVSVFAPYPVLEANSANKFYDYLACGLPVALNYLGWQAQYLEHHACGAGAPQGNTQAFVRALHTARAYAAQPAARARARSLATEHFDRRQIADHLLDFYARLTRPYAWPRATAGPAATRGHELS
jgi:glycosyltransferase involved in cell wall biosynthesis